MPGGVMRASLAWFALTTVIFWLPTVRGAFDGPSYQWGLFGLGGRGMGGDYWFPLIAACGALVVSMGAWRRRRWAFAAVAAWSVLLAVALIVAIASNPDDFRFRGDTLGIDVSLAWFGPPIFASAAAVCLLAAWRSCRGPRIDAVAWRSHNVRWLAILGAALPVQFTLLRLGAIGSVLDQVGVLITIAQWLLVGRVFRPYARRAAD